MSELQVYNTLTGRKEKFTPLVPGQIGMYVCGVTVYDHCHIGHARGAIIFDVIRRYLEYRGFAVKYIRNITDIDDKIIKRAQEEGCTAKEIAQKYTVDYYQDMERLGVRQATFEPKATEHIEEIIALIRRLEERGYAYRVEGGDVYFDIRKFPAYGRLSKRSLDSMQAGARVEVDSRKKDPLDFVLWKSAKEGEPAWESPWGAGRPGWHIECSAMSIKHLGETFDIHGGGEDLIFPHHENEIAQSEAATGKPFVRYWLHNGFVNINQEKMSKSLKNFFTIKEVLARYSSETLRLFLLSTHYRSPVNFTTAGLDEAARALERVYNTFETAEYLIKAGGGGEQERGWESQEESRLVASTQCLSARGSQKPGQKDVAWQEIYSSAQEGSQEPLSGAQEPEAAGEQEPAAGGSGRDHSQRRAQTVKQQDEAVLGSLRAAFEAAMDDDFNTAEAIGRLWEAVKEVNIFIHDHPSMNNDQRRHLRQMVDLIRELGGVLGLFQESKAWSKLADDDNIVNDLMEIILEIRNICRAKKDWTLADQIRSRLQEKGIVLEDRKEGTVWKRK